MKLYDEKGALVINPFPIPDGLGTIDITPVFSINTVISFSDLGSNVRIKNGKLQIKDDIDELWRYVGSNIGAGGSMYLSDTTESS